MCEKTASFSRPLGGSPLDPPALLVAWPPRDRPLTCSWGRDVTEQGNYDATVRFHGALAFIRRSEHLSFLGQASRTAAYRLVRATFNLELANSRLTESRADSGADNFPSGCADNSLNATSISLMALAVGELYECRRFRSA